MQLSKNLHINEVVKSNTAIRLGIDNIPTCEHLCNLKLLAINLFQPIRDHFSAPIYISSGYRSKVLNRAINGSKTSLHCKGMAIDIDQINSKISNADIFYYIKDNLDFTELIWEFGDDENPDWVHVGYDPNNLKKEVLISYKDFNIIKYKYYET